MHPRNVDEVAIARTRTNLKRRAGNELVAVPTLYRDEEADLLLENPEAAAVLPSFR